LKKRRSVKEIWGVFCAPYFFMGGNIARVKGGLHKMKVVTEKIFKKFKKVIDTRDINHMDKQLYNYLHLHAGFIAHYDSYGFKETYSDKGFLDFIEHFEQCYYLCYGEYGDFNRELKEYVLQHAEQIRAEFAYKAQQHELKQLQKLAAKHGKMISDVARSEEKDMTPALVPMSLATNGQLEFAL
jgi:hypothetical protein